MPELPEVQTVVSDLKQKIIGETITDFWSDWPKAIKNLSLVKFRKKIKNRKILGVRRIGKNIFIDLSGGKTLYIHLKMTGHLLVKSKVKSKPCLPAGRKSKVDYFGDKVNQYIHHIWYLKDKQKKIKTLEFSDVRKFAKIVLDDTQKISALPEIKKLGVDALSSQLTLRKFQEILSAQSAVPTGKQGSVRGGKKIGLVLMEQELIAGIGNIYRSEILFEAKLNPLKMIRDLTEKEWQKLYFSMKKVLKKAIKMRGTSESDYRDTSGAPGSFQRALRVYKKNGEKCAVCGIIVKRQILGQRSLFFCPKCQQ